MNTNISSYEENGRYYLMDAQGSIETTELINVDEMEYDECLQVLSPARRMV